MHGLADFLVHSAVAAHAQGFRIVDVHPENTFVAVVNGETLVPDHRFDLLNGAGERYRYLIELDNSTETIRSVKHEQETWQRKIRLHDAYQDQCDQRHRVVVVTTRSRDDSTTSWTPRPPRFACLSARCLSVFTCRNTWRAMTPHEPRAWSIIIVGTFLCCRHVHPLPRELSRTTPP